MLDTRVLVIDDVDAAMASMTELGRAVTTNGAQAVRSAVLAFAARSGWQVARYEAYQDWARRSISDDTFPWVVLDPLFRVADLGEKVRPLRLTRQYGPRREMIEGPTADWSSRRIDGPAGIVDDAAGTGRTLLHVAQLLGQVGGSVRRVLLCCSSRMSRESLRSRIPHARIAEFVPGDWRVIHLRDGCPYLPYSGRPIEHPPVVAANGSPIEVRVPPTVVRGNLWQVMAIDRGVRDVIASARADAVLRFGAAVGRRAVVGDLWLLGESVGALADGTDEVLSNQTAF